MKHSERIADFLNLLRESKNEFIYSAERLVKHNEYTQDILHDIELNEHTPDELNGLMQDLIYARRDRRIDKNINEITAPIKMFAVQADVNIVLHKLEKLLGEVRKIEQYHENRAYRRKVEVIARE